MKLLKKLKPYKRELVLGSLACLFILSVFKLAEFHKAKILEAKVEGCTKAAVRMVHPLLQPACEFHQEELVLSVNPMGMGKRIFSLETGNEIFVEQE